MLNDLTNQSGASTRCQAKMTFRSQPKRRNKTGTETETETETESETETKTDTITDTDTRLLSNGRFVPKEQVYVVGNNTSIQYSQSKSSNELVARWQNILHCLWSQVLWRGKSLEGEIL